MKAIVIHKAGDAQQLQLEERPIPALKEGWTLVKVKGFGINRSEIFTRQGHSPSVIFPRILGIECVGVVEATTSPTLQKGQTVVLLMGEMGRAFDGSYAEYTLLPNEQVYPITTTLSWKVVQVMVRWWCALAKRKTLTDFVEDFKKLSLSELSPIIKLLEQPEIEKIHINGD